MVMPAGIGREELRTLTGQGAQLAEVLPAEEYAWAHLPGAVSLPLKELDALAGQLDRSRPVYDYAAGKADWLAADLPFEGTAELAGMFTRRGVAAVAEDTPLNEALGLLDTQGSGRSWSSTRRAWSWAPPTGTRWPPPGTPRLGRLCGSACPRCGRARMPRR